MGISERGCIRDYRFIVFMISLVYMTHDSMILNLICFSGSQHPCPSDRGHTGHAVIPPRGDHQGRTRTNARDTADEEAASGEEGDHLEFVV